MGSHPFQGTPFRFYLHSSRSDSAQRLGSTVRCQRPAQRSAGFQACRQLSRNRTFQQSLISGVSRKWCVAQCPVSRSRRRCRKQGIGRAANMMSCAGAVKLQQGARPTGTLWRLFQIAHAVQQGLCPGHGCGTKAPLPQGARPCVSAIEGRHIETCQRLHHAAELIGCLGCDEQLKLVVEQHVGMHRDVVLDAATPENLQKVAAVIGACKCQASRHRAMNHVVSLASDSESIQASHKEIRVRRPTNTICLTSGGIFTSQRHETACPEPTFFLLWSSNHVLSQGFRSNFQETLMSERTSCRRVWGKFGIVTRPVSSRSVVRAN